MRTTSKKAMKDDQLMSMGMIQAMLAESRKDRQSSDGRPMAVVIMTTGVVRYFYTVNDGLTVTMMKQFVKCDRDPASPTTKPYKINDIFGVKNECITVHSSRRPAPANLHATKFVDAFIGYEKGTLYMGNVLIMVDPQTIHKPIHQSLLDILGWVRPEPETVNVAPHTPDE